MNIAEKMPELIAGSLFQINRPFVSLPFIATQLPEPLPEFGIPRSDMAH